MEGHDLDGAAVRLDATHGRVVAEAVRRPGRADEPLERVEDGARWDRSPADLRVQQLAEMLEVGPAALARTCQRCGDVRLARQLDEERQDPPASQPTAPGRAPLLERLDQLGVAERRQRCRDEPRQQQRTDAVAAVRCLEGTEEDPPLLDGVGREHVTGARADRREADGAQGRHDVLGLVARADEDRQVAGRERLAGCPVDVRRPHRAEQLDGPCREVAQHERVAETAAELPLCDEVGVARDPADLEVARRTREDRPGTVRCGDRVVGDLGGPEGRATQQQVERAEEARGRAMVDAQDPHVLGVAARPQISVHVGAAEPVDRLLRIADDDHVGGRPEPLVVAERTAEHPPLHGVRVLHLVHEHQAEPFPERADRDGAAGRIVEDLVQAGDQLAEVELGPDLQPAPQLGHGRRDEAGPGLRGVRLGPPAEASRGRPGLEHGGRIVEGALHGAQQPRFELPRVPAVGVLGIRQRLGVVGEGGDEQVADHVVAVAPRRAGGLPPTEVAEEAEPHQRGATERVQRRDRRPLEPDERGGRRLETLPTRRRVDVGEGPDPGVRRRSRTVRGAGERTRGGTQIAADPRPQLIGRGAREGHDEQPARVVPALDEPARGQRRERERLPGAGARVQRQQAGRERAGQVQRARHAASSTVVSTSTDAT